MPIQNIESHAAGGARQISTEGRVIRCTCTPAEKALIDWHGRINKPCPRGRVEELGVIAFWHANPFKRFAWHLSRLMRAVRALCKPTRTTLTDWSRYG